MNIALRQLKVFVTVAQELTITAAAEKLFPLQAGCQHGTVRTGKAARPQAV